MNHNEEIGKYQMGAIDPVRYYYKCPKTGVEMDFRKIYPFGWCISFPREEDNDKTLCLDIPWPSLSDEALKLVGQFNWMGGVR